MSLNFFCIQIRNVLAFEISMSYSSSFNLELLSSNLSKRVKLFLFCQNEVNVYYRNLIRCTICDDLICSADNYVFFGPGNKSIAVHVEDVVKIIIL